LQAELADKDSLIVKLDTKVSELGKNVEDLSADNKSKETKIKNYKESCGLPFFFLVPFLIFCFF